jgi:hypothetical protein
MGTWGTGISSNDTYADAYGEFFDLYNDGIEVAEITARLVSRNQETIGCPDAANDFWFALAKAQWECKALDNALLERVTMIVESGADIEVWRNQDASQNDLRKREAVLRKFLDKISHEKAKPRKPKRVLAGTPVFEKGDCLTFRFSTGNYGGAIVLDTLIGKGYAYNLVASTRINQPEEPNETTFRKSDVIICNFAAWEKQEWIYWLLCETFARDAGHFQLVGRLKVSKEFSFFDYGAAGDWKIFLIDSVEQQFEYEKSHSISGKRIKVSSLIQRNWLPFL